MGVSDWSGTLLAWDGALSGLKDRLGPLLGRLEVRQSASAFIDGVLSDAERKTGWLLAEHAGLSRPYRMQSLLGRSRWDADAVCRTVRAYVIEALGGGDGALVTLCMAAAAFLAKLAADLRRDAEAKRNERSPASQIAA